MDVGKLRVEASLLQAARPLTQEEADRMRDHVSTESRLSGERDDEPGWLDIVEHHHERYDGSGYPQGLSGDKIPAMARIAAIVDTYDAVTSNRSTQPPSPRPMRSKLLYRSRNIEFQAELVEVFIQAVGIYPAGTIVELTSGEVGWSSECRTRRLKPKILTAAGQAQIPPPRTQTG